MLNADCWLTWRVLRGRLEWRASSSYLADTVEDRADLADTVEDRADLADTVEDRADLADTDEGRVDLADTVEDRADLADKTEDKGDVEDTVDEVLKDKCRNSSEDVRPPIVLSNLMNYTQFFKENTCQV